VDWKEEGDDDDYDHVTHGELQVGKSEEAPAVKEQKPEEVTGDSGGKGEGGGKLAPAAASKTNKKKKGKKGRGGASAAATNQSLLSLADQDDPVARARAKVLELFNKKKSRGKSSFATSCAIAAREAAGGSKSKNRPKVPHYAC
jgi:hypothetical protein